MTYEKGSQEEIAELRHQGLEGVDRVDWILLGLTLLPSFFVLQFANTPMSRIVHYRRSRRRLLVGMLLLEVVAIALVVAWVLR